MTRALLLRLFFNTVTKCLVYSSHNINFSYIKKHFSTKSFHSAIKTGNLEFNCKNCSTINHFSEVLKVGKKPFWTNICARQVFCLR